MVVERFEKKYLKSKFEKTILATGRALNRLFELRAEMSEFLSTIPDKPVKTEKKKNKKTARDLKNLLDDGNLGFLTKLSYLCDIFQRLNDLNLSLQVN
jgi:hypothetical protein